MNICLIGDGLISLTLAQTLINNGIKVFMHYEKNNKVFSNNRTIGITANNLVFFQKKIIKIKKNFFWDIDHIEIFNDQNKKEKILNFKKPKEILFSIVKNKNLYNLLNKSLENSKNFKKIIIKDKYFYKKISTNTNYDFIINCDANNEISKRYFHKKIIKNYHSTAYATIINHNKIENKTAMQIFTQYGPLAFLPISKNQTSIVYSIKNQSIKNNLKLAQKEFEQLIFLNNKKYKINSINKIETFIIKSKTLRNYYNKNILAFGDMLHQLHPLSGQGFNMTLRDIKIFLTLLREKENLGIPIDYSILKEFERKTKHLNFIFSSGNDFIYEFFNHDNFFYKQFSKKIFPYLKKSNLISKLSIKYADRGLII